MESRPATPNLFGESLRIALPVLRQQTAVTGSTTAALFRTPAVGAGVVFLRSRLFFDRACRGHADGLAPPVEPTSPNPETSRRNESLKRVGPLRLSTFRIVEATAADSSNPTVSMLAGGDGETDSVSETRRPGEGDLLRELWPDCRARMSGLGVGRRVEESRHPGGGLANSLPRPAGGLAGGLSERRTTTWGGLIEIPRPTEPATRSGPQEMTGPSRRQNLALPNKTAAMPLP